jgi:hypothetical protein
MSNRAEQASRLWTRDLLRLPEALPSSRHRARNAWSARVPHRCREERLHADSPTSTGSAPASTFSSLMLCPTSPPSWCAVPEESHRRPVCPPVSSPSPAFHHRGAASPMTAAPSHGPELIPPQRALHHHHAPPRLLRWLPQPHVWPSAAGQRHQSAATMEKPLR